MTDAEILLKQVRDACQTMGIAQTTFGRLAVNDGKFVARLERGGRVTVRTVERVHEFIARHGGASAEGLRSAIIGLSPPVKPENNFRFYDNRQKYLMFVNTTTEKQTIANLAIDELSKSQPQPPAIRLFDGGAGDGTVLARMLRGMHQRYKSLPFFVVAKEISKENVRLTLQKMPDRFQEHPATMLVLTNLRYRDAPWLRPSSSVEAKNLVWKELSLEGETAGEFEEQIEALDPFLDENWQASISAKSGNPSYKTPTVLVIYRADHKFLLDPVLPRRDHSRADFDLALLSQPYRAQASIEFKAQKVVAPIVSALRQGGRLLGVQSYGNDPGYEIIKGVWPEANGFPTGRQEIVRAVKQELGGQVRNFTFHKLPDPKAVFRYNVNGLPSEFDPHNGEVGISTAFGAWISAVYVAQIEDARLAAAMANNDYLEKTQAVLRKHKGLWFNDEYFIISRNTAHL